MNNIKSLLLISSIGIFTLFAGTNPVNAGSRPYKVKTIVLKVKTVKRMNYNNGNPIYYWVKLYSLKDIYSDGGYRTRTVQVRI